MFRSLQFRMPSQSIEVKNLFHLRPPLSLLPCRQRFLHRLHHCPPFLSLVVRSHFAPVTLQVASVVLEIAEEEAVLEEDRIVSDVAFRNLCQHFRPDRGVISLVGFLATWLKPDRHSKALHRCLPWCSPQNVREKIRIGSRFI